MPLTPFLRRPHLNHHLFGTFNITSYLCSVNARRDKAKRQRNQLNQQLESVTVKTKKSSGRWKENLGKYLLDVSKYVLTGVVISSLFQNMSDYYIIYLLGVITVVITLLAGLVLTNKKVEDE